MAQQDTKTMIPLDRDEMNELLEPVRVAILLGAKIPAVTGTTGYRVAANSRVYKDEDEYLGFFGTQEAATDALAAWALREYRHGDEEIATWFNPDSEVSWEEQEVLFRSSYTHQEIIDLYLKTNPNANAWIEKFTIEDFCLENKFNPALAGTVPLRDFVGPEYS